MRLPDWKYIKYDIEQLWYRINLRGRINANPRIIVAITNLSIIIFIIAAINLFGNGKIKRIPDYDKEWFYDLNTSRLFAGAKELVPPIEAPSGALPDGGLAGVRAYVFSYVDEPNESEMYIGFLETTDPNYRETIVNNPNDIRRWGQGMLIRRITDKKWVHAESREGREIFEEATTPDENGHNPQYCTPK